MTPSAQTTMSKFLFDGKGNNDHSGIAIAEKISMFNANNSIFNKPTVAQTLSYFHTDAMVNQHLSTLPCHSLGLIAAALRLEIRGEQSYAFTKLYEEHIAFLHSWAMTQADIDEFELYPTLNCCSELYEQLITSQFFVYCTILHIDTSYTQQLNLDLFITDEDPLGNQQRRLAVINKGQQPNQILTVHPQQYQLHLRIKNQNVLGIEHDMGSGNNTTNNATSGDGDLQLHRVKIQCSLTRLQFFNFLKDYKAYLNKVRFIQPLDYESVPIWVDSLLDNEIKTTNTV